MATTILIVCPECGKQIKAPDNVLGKRVRCKFCQAAFVASQGAAKPPTGKSAKPPANKPAKPPANKPAAGKPSKPAKPAVDEEDDENPYGVTDTDLAYRCPDCANEMESEDAIVCLICGYNTQTRERIHTRKIHGNTTGEQILWLLPGIVCVLAIISVIIFDIWYLMKIDDMVDEKEFFWGILAHKGIKFWVVLISLFILFFTGKFALKRLIIHYAPPEIEKTK
ncbi:MAG TPA: hypothetical protein VN688_02490 [Gemmataceae bacterium]|nr:hypothetical protein [Gemmataceae bacterium]